MKRYRRLPLVLFALLIISALSLIGVRLYQLEQRDLHLQRVELHESFLKIMVNDISLFLEDWTQSIQKQLLPLGADAEKLRTLRRNDGRIQQIFTLDSGDELLFPAPEAMDLSESEVDFLKRIDPILKGGELLRPIEDEGQSFKIKTRYKSSLKSKKISVPTERYHPWFTYFWAQGLQPIYIFSSRNGQTVGVELERVRLLADLIAHISENTIFAPQNTNQKLDIRDHNGQILHQWGTWKEREILTLVASTPLPSPLSSWTINYSNGQSGGLLPLGNATLFNVVAGLTTFLILLLALVKLILRDQQRQFEEAEKRVSFVNQVSHELKTPLTNIRMYAELLEQRLDGEDEKEQKFLSIIVDESQRLSRLIENVLTFRKTEKQSLAVNKTPEDVVHIVNDVLEQFSPSLTELGITWEINGPPDLHALVDRDVLQQILGNLISNVEKYARNADLLSISVSCTADQTTIDVHDNGPGVSDSLLSNIFQPFVRGESSLVEGVSGSGIGLSIARTLARLHGGDLIALNTETFTVFRLTLLTPRTATTTSEDKDNESTDS